MCKRLFACLLCLVTALTLLPAMTHAENIAAASAVQVHTGILKITTYPSGADVYIDGERYLPRTTPCAVALSEGTHDVALVIPGYEECRETVEIRSEEPATLERKILPAIPAASDTRIITVTAEEDTEPDDSLTYESLTGLDCISLRQALTAAANDLSDRWYRIEFAEDVEHIELVNHILSYSRDNLIINGDKNRDGTPDVTMTQTNWGLLFRPMKNLYLMGIRFADSCMVAIRPDDFATTDGYYENIYLLGCKFENAGLIPFCGACKVYASGGKTNYTNVYCCGCDLGNANLFLSYSGNCDNSVTDGVYYCANTLTEEGMLTVNCADCNTWYIYGGDTNEGNGGVVGQFETSDHNIVRNIQVSGNTGGQFCCSVGVCGNSDNAVSDMVLRNNYFTNSIFLRPCQPIDEKNEGNRLSTSDNVLENVTLEYNVFDFRARDDAFIWVAVLAFDSCAAETQLILHNNVIRNLQFRDNLYLGRENLTSGKIDAGIDYTLESGQIMCRAMLEAGDPGEAQTDYGNNRIEGIVFTGNRKVESYNPYDLWNADHPDAADLTLLLRHVAGIEVITDSALLERANVDGIGGVDAADITKLAQYLAG